MTKPKFLIEKKKGTLIVPGGLQELFLSVFKHSSA
jgi:hypothetical protein